MEIKYKKIAISVGVISVIWPIVILFRQLEAITLYINNIFDVRIPTLTLIALSAVIFSLIAGFWLLIKAIKQQPHATINIIVIMLILLIFLVAPWADWAIRFPLEKMNEIFE